MSEPLMVELQAYEEAKRIFSWMLMCASMFVLQESLAWLLLTGVQFQPRTKNTQQAGASLHPPWGSGGISQQALVCWLFIGTLHVLLRHMQQEDRCGGGTSCLGSHWNSGSGACDHGGGACSMNGQDFNSGGWVSVWGTVFQTSPGTESE